MKKLLRNALEIITNMGKKQTTDKKPAKAKSPKRPATKSQSAPKQEAAPAPVVSEEKLPVKDETYYAPAQVIPAEVMRESSAQRLREWNKRPSRKRW